MNPQPSRPEDRRRPEQEKPIWADTQPDFFRSEGFAEDLHDALHDPLDGIQGSVARRARPRWLSDAALPLLGVALAGAMGMMGVFAR